LTTLTELEKILRSTPALTKAVGLRSLGEVLQLVGNVDQSRQDLEQSLQIAQRFNSQQDMSAAFFSLGNTARTQEDTKAALKFYQPAVGTAGSTLSNSLQTTKIQAQLNQLSLLLETKQWQDAQALWPQIQSEIPKLPSSRTAVYAKINFAQSLALLRQATTADALSDLDIAQLLVAAVKQSKSLSDQRSISYALGSLGGLYEQTQQWSDAKDLTQQALLLTQASNTPDIAYRWQWQLGRLLKKQADIPPRSDRLLHRSS
jgi:hypothetical protein